jgi:S-DNA-T family DNA segregation ATPase FtsK/SpoIIIE
VVGTLQAVINEMDSRYRTFEKAGARDIAGYNDQTQGPGLPYWVLIIDELADLMISAPYQVEHQVVRLAQLARATGIHLVIATQRPSVDVVTGLIKANFPTRIAFAMSSQVDSRTVLDRAGADKLLGRGDMLYQPIDAQTPTRVQGVFVADEETTQVVDFWTGDRFQELVPEKHDDLLAEGERQAGEDGVGVPDQDNDPMVQRALELASESSRISTSMLQRRLRIGYPRAARIMDELKERGIVGAPETGGSSRQVLRDSEPATPPTDAADGQALPAEAAPAGRPSGGGDGG